MILPPGFAGAAFTSAGQGDVRSDPIARSRVAAALGIQPDWAIARQVHGAQVLLASEPGLLGEADALFTVQPGLPVSVATADCLPVVLGASGAVGVAHAGWRGLAGGVLEALRSAMEEAGAAPVRAAIGPSIGPCCYEVGKEVAELFPEHSASTEWGSTSVDLWRAAADRLAGLRIWRSRHCTRCRGGFFSHRGGGATGRQVAVAWLP